MANFFNYNPPNVALQNLLNKNPEYSAAQQKNQAQAKSGRRGNLTEAKMLTRGVRIRYANNPEMIEMVDKTDQDIDKELAQLK